MQLFGFPPLSTTYITCPADPKKTLGIKLPFLVMIIKNLKKYFTFEVQVGAQRQREQNPGSPGTLLGAGGARPRRLFPWLLPGSVSLLAEGVSSSC